MGSVTTPPCTEGVHHWIMSVPILVSSSLLQSIKSSAYRGLELRGNARKVYNIIINIIKVQESFADIVFYHQESKPCSKTIPESISQEVEDGLN